MYYIIFPNPILEKLHIRAEMEIIMYQTSIAFSKAQPDTDLLATASSLYTEEAGYGFVIERNRNEQELLQFPELNSAYSTWYWDNGKELTVLTDTEQGVCISDSSAYEAAVLPLSFKINVPRQGNYQLSITVNGGEKGCDNLTIFTGRRHLAARCITLQPQESRTIELTVNVCDIIPRGKEEAYTDTTLDITLFGSQVILSRISVSEADVRTIYIAGDSTVTDQSGAYPYDPGCCYSGWGQMLSAYLKPGISVSNHAHSGLTTESFRSEGHYDIVRRFIKAGDYYLMQFAHNDQKLPELDAAGGYRSRLIRYIEEVRSVGAIPVIVTPLARNTWKGDGTYNDLLVDYAAECIRVGKEYQVPVLDLHQFSMDFVLKEGLDSAKRYFYPKDYTHTNDYGAYLMAGYIASQLTAIDELAAFPETDKPAWIPPQVVALPQPPAGYETEAVSKLPAEKDLERPEEIITRVEFLNYLVTTVGYVPMNVYNDMYPDVIGHEWYAGVVEVSYQNSLVNAEYTADGSFHPLEPVTWEQLVSFSINGYKSRKGSSLTEEPLTIARNINIISDSYQPEKTVTRKEALASLKALEKVL